MSSNSSPLSMVFVSEKNRLVVGVKGKICVVQLGSSNVQDIVSSKLSSPVSLVYSAQNDAVFIGDSESIAIYRWDWGTEEVVSVLENI